MEKRKKAVRSNPTHAEILLVEARSLAAVIRPAYYYNSILVLRSKGLSFQEIALWLQAHGVNVNRGQVYYVWCTYVNRSIKLPPKS